MATTRDYQIKMKKFLTIIFLYTLTTLFFITSVKTSEDALSTSYRNNLIARNFPDFSKNDGQATSKYLDPYPKRNQNSLIRGEESKTKLLEDKVVHYVESPFQRNNGNLESQKSILHSESITFSPVFSGIFGVGESAQNSVISKSKIVKSEFAKPNSRVPIHPLYLEPYSKRPSSNIFSGIFASDSVFKDEVFSDNNKIQRNKRETKNICEMEQCQCTHTRGNHFNISCQFDNRENVIIDLSSIPDTTSELNIKGNPGRVTVYSPVFYSMSALDLLSVTGASQVTFKAGSNLQNASGGSPAVRLAVHNCADVKVEKRALKVAKKQVIHVEMVDVAEIQIAGDAFEHLQNATFRNVSRMVLESRSFAYNPVASSQGATTTIFFQNVIFESLPKNTFVNPADEIQMVNCNIPMIQERAFSAPMYHSVLLRNSSIRRIEFGAFAAGTLVKKLSVVSCIITDLESGALQSAADSLIFVKNRITNLHKSAINVTAATLEFSQNTIENCDQDALSLREWSNITIHNNLFDKISGQILQPEHATYSLIPFLSFSENSIRRISDNGLKFLFEKLKIETKANNNYFEEKCGCEISNWLSRKLGKRGEQVEQLQKTSYCTIDVMLAKCMNVADGNILIQTYLDKICVPAENVQCVPFTGELLVENDQLQNPRFPNKQSGEDDTKYELILWISIGAVGILLVLAIFLAISVFTCKRKVSCCKRDQDSLGSTPASDIVAQMNAVQETENAVDANDNQNYNQVTRTEEEGQLYPLLTNERLQDLNHRWKSEDEAVRKAACEEIVKLYQTIKRQNNNGGSTTRATNTDIDLYETIEDALNRRPPPDLLESTVTSPRSTVPVNDYAQPKDSINTSNDISTGGAACYAVGNCYRSPEYSEPDVTSQRLGVSGIVRQLEQKSSSPIPYMDATLNSNGSYGSDNVTTKMVNRPLPKPPNNSSTNIK